ncbi:hypothetical protein [Sphingomonas sp. CFBP 13733]|uniref:hypothetical protein n=1 Tax=Sphingomonas sp. CFBP 13733 TaxID=2775291 RepID=UPI001784D761|nr:hypothetical protein [Sphingomonas sp. CFBP 13733]MBD8640233.1 hypothetical protein [Sphingomonas sp. CFBP 13733]
MTNIEQAIGIVELCALVSGAMGMDRRTRNEMLAGVGLPVGYSSVLLTYAESGETAAFLYRRSAAGTPSASDIAVSMALSGSMSVLPVLESDVEQGVLSLSISGKARQRSAEYACVPQLARLAELS